jgi:EpsI family protein
MRVWGSKVLSLGHSIEQDLEPTGPDEAPALALTPEPQAGPAFRRRDLLIAAACAAAVGGAYALKPRRQMALLGQTSLEDALPRTMSGWTSQDVSDLVKPREESSLAARIYGQTVGRIYFERSTRTQIMMLAAFGDTQSRDLQLHRPELCYPAVGFAISANQLAPVTLPGGAVLPARRMVADAPGRREAIVYWSRLGEYLPVSGGEQRLDVLKTAMSGYVADGVLMRFSALGLDPERNFAHMARFIPVLLMATPAQHRPALIGHRLAAALG